MDVDVLVVVPDDCAAAASLGCIGCSGCSAVGCASVIVRWCVRLGAGYDRLVVFSCGVVVTAGYVCLCRRVICGVPVPFFGAI